MNDTVEAFLQPQLVQLIDRPFQTNIIESPNEVTRREVAQFVGSRLSANVLDVVSKDGGSIKISQIISLYSATAHRKERQRQLVVIHEANRMSLPAQNALLKLLEEPPTFVHFLLTVPRAETLLPTIRSRALVWSIKGLSEKEFGQRITATKNESELKRLYVLSSGDPIAALADLPEATYAEQAKQLMSQSLFLALSRLNQDNLAKDEAAKLVSGLVLIADQSLKMARNHANTVRWVRLAEWSLSAQDLLLQNVSPRLVLARLLLAWHQSPIM